MGAMKLPLAVDTYVDVYDYIFTHMCLEFFGVHDVNVSHIFGGLLIGWVLFALMLKYA